MRRDLLSGLIGLLLFSIAASSVLGQQVIPPARIANMEGIPGLTNALGETITNGMAGEFTGTLSGRVDKVGRQLVINYPSFESWLTTNTFVSSFVISNTGLTTVHYPYEIFRGTPFIQFMYVNLPDDIVITPILSEVNSNYFTVKFLSSGSMITNEWTIYYLASENMNFGYYGNPAMDIEHLVDGTNVMKRDGSVEMTGKMTAPYIQLMGDGSKSWIAGDTNGNMVWQERYSYNLQDGNNILKRDGSASLTGNLDGGMKEITNLYALQVKTVNGSRADNPADDYVLTSFTGDGQKGMSTWKQFGANVWAKFKATDSINVNGKQMYNLAQLYFNQGQLGGWGGYSYTHGTYGDVLEWGYKPNNGSSYIGQYGTGSNNFYHISPVKVENGVYLKGNIKTGIGAPTYVVNKYALYSETPIAVKNGIMVGDETILNAYTPPTYSICAYGGFYGVGKHYIFASKSQLDAATGSLWDYIDNYYKIAFSGERAAFYNTTVLIGTSLDKFNLYKTATGPNLFVEGDVGVGGALTVVGAKSFRIKHPIADKKYLYHYSIEAPRAELVYRGKATLTNGKAIIDIDSYFGMTAGTFKAMNKDFDIQVWNNNSWDKVRGRDNGDGTFTIESENINYNGEVSFVVYGVRKDITTKVEDNK
jgi:hypothetical protein